MTKTELRDNQPADKKKKFAEHATQARLQTGNHLFDGLYALAISEARANSVAQVSDGSYAKGAPFQIEAFQTGEYWTYVWTRDLAYSLHLGLAAFDPPRAVNSLLFKSSVLKPAVRGGLQHQIVQDTGSGGSYPVSTDRVVWAMGAHETLKHLPPADRQAFLEKAYPIIAETAEQDRHLVFDPRDGLYRGEQSFLDWREQTYPGWTKNNVLAIAMSKALSTNAAHYFLLRSAAEYAGRLNKTDEQARYAQWADDLQRAINRHFYDEKTGLYSTYLLSDDGRLATRVRRYDLLGESLAILFGIADAKQAAAIIQNYPTGPFGPPVVWPQEETVPIYHNQAIWPFVTAYWLKAARLAGHPAAVDAGIQSLQDLAAANLSNMENFDFVSGRAEIKTGARKGPQVNSRRQLWSVAGYLSMVQDVVFGLQTSWDGIRFVPCITARLRNETFASTDTVELQNFGYQRTRHRVRLHLPPAHSFAEGICRVEKVELNGRAFGEGFANLETLEPENAWDIFLAAPAKPAPALSLRRVDVSDERALCGPVQPRWSEAGEGAITLKGARLVLHYAHDDAAHVSFNLYRDGKLCAEGIRETEWADPHSGAYRDVVHTYAVEAVDLKSGLVSHRTPGRSYREPDQTKIIPAKELHTTGGNLVRDHHFENWGKPAHEVSTRPFQVARGGRYSIRAEFANGSGPVNTGITCAVKKIEVRQAAGPEAVASGYLIMPQSSDWKRYDLSSAIEAQLRAGEDYTLRISEDEYCRNMSYLQSNERYTANPGGGDTSSNFVNLAAVHLLFLARSDGAP